MSTSPLPSTSRSLSTAEHLYRIFLLLYPKGFRQGYEQEMILTFRDCYREALQRSGTPGLIRFCGFILGELVVTACLQHLRNMKTMFYRMLGLEQERIMAHLLHLDVGSLTDIGRKRPSNEDNLTSVIPQDPEVLAKKGALFIVADGMGGHSRGEVASQLVVQTVSETYYRNTSDDIPTVLQNAVKYANSTVYWQGLKDSEKQDNESKKGSMGSTCLAAVLLDDTLYVANVGDSRAYIIRDSQPRQITHDHSIVYDLVREGKITREEARTHDQRNIITRSMGTQGEVEVDLFTETVQDSDILLFCTDGLSGLVDDQEICTIVEQYGPQESASQLIARANEQGGPDNVTAIVARVEMAA